MLVEDKIKKCVYHQEMIGHDIEQCLNFRVKVQRFDYFGHFDSRKSSRKEGSEKKHMCLIAKE